jgi:hypothetical protein
MPNHADMRTTKLYVGAATRSPWRIKCQASRFGSEASYFGSFNDLGFVPYTFCPYLRRKTRGLALSELRSDPWRFLQQLQGKNHHR